jgi:putative addiction module component (TIGR02574 family)
MNGVNNFYRINANGTSYTATPILPTSPIADGDRLRLIARGPVIYGIKNGVREFIYNTGPNATKYSTGTSGMLAYVSSPSLTDATIASWSSGAAPVSSGTWASSTFAGVENPLDEGDRWYPPTPRRRKLGYATYDRGSRSKTASSLKRGEKTSACRVAGRGETPVHRRGSRRPSRLGREEGVGGGAFRGWMRGDGGEVLAGVACLGHGRRLDSPYMARVEEHLAELLRLPVDERARAARALLDSLDEDGEDAGVEQAQVTELIRRMQALHAGQVKLIDDAEARARVMARLRSVRGQ